MIADTFRKNCVNMTVPDKPRLLKIRDIQHLYTPVEGQLNEDATILQLTKSLHPTPALGEYHVKKRWQPSVNMSL